MTVFARTMYKTVDNRAFIRRTEPKYTFAATNSVVETNTQRAMRDRQQRRRHTHT